MLVPPLLPFRFPALFTFVVRAFSVLDGLGKTLDPKFDITEISAPYARELVLEGPQERARKELREGLDNQNLAFKNLFRNPNRIERVENTLLALERGDLKLRVRALEAERQIDRMAIMQNAQTSAVLAGVFFNVGAVLTTAAAAPALAATASYGAAAVCGLGFLKGLMKVRKLEKKERQLSGQT